MNIHHLYRPFMYYFRTKRMKQFHRLFELEKTTQIMDVGGDLFNWSLIPNKPNLIIVNLYKPRENSILNGVTWIIADGCALPFPDQSVEIVYSNSVIEHLSTLENQKRFADEVRRVGKKYYVQTPNRYFWIEPHLLTPFIHFLPKKRQKRFLRHFSLWGWLTHPSTQQIERFLEEIRLLNKKELESLFPDGIIWDERFFVWVKSYMVCKL